MELLGHRVCLCSALERLLNSYAMCLYQFILLTNFGESLGMSGEVTVFSPTIDNADKFIFAILVNVFQLVFPWWLIKLNIFSNIFCHLNTYCLVWVFCSFFYWGVCLSWWHVGIFSIFWVWVLCQSNKLQISSSLWVSFSLSFFDDKKVQILM